jgi:hypothetical protein
VTENHEGPEIPFRAETGELYSLDKKERKLVKEVLRLSLATPSGRKLIRGRFGEKGFRIAEGLLQQMGIKVEDSRDNT